MQSESGSLRTPQEPQPGGPPSGGGPSAPPAAGAPGQGGLYQVGVVLLLVAWILNLVFIVLGLLAAVAMFALGRFAGWPMIRDFFWEMGPFRMDRWPFFEGLAVVFIVLLAIVGVVVTLLLVLAWDAARRGDRQRGGILGIVGGALMFFFSGLVGLVGLVGGIIVLVADQGGAQLTTAAQGAPARRGTGSGATTGSGIKRGGP